VALRRAVGERWKIGKRENNRVYYLVKIKFNFFIREVGL